jgi:hypothetical protein
MRLPAMPGERRGPEAWQQICEVSRVQSGDLLLQGPRRRAPVRARGPVRGADSDLRLSEVRGVSRHRCQVSSVQSGDVLRQEAQINARIGAREQMRGAALV